MDKRTVTCDCRVAFATENNIRSLLDAKSKGPLVISHTYLINCHFIEKQSYKPTDANSKAFASNLNRKKNPNQLASLHYFTTNSSVFKDIRTHCELPAKYLIYVLLHRFISDTKICFHINMFHHQNNIIKYMHNHF